MTISQFPNYKYYSIIFLTLFRVLNYVLGGVCSDVRVFIIMFLYMLLRDCYQATTIEAANLIFEFITLKHGNFSFRQDYSFISIYSSMINVVLIDPLFI